MTDPEPRTVPAPVDPTPVDRSELPGMEFDWIGADRAGQLGQFLASGIGMVPDAALSSEEALFELHLLLDELPLREPLSIPEGDFEAELALPQRRGLYVFDAQEDSRDERGRAGTYRLVAAPAQPLTLAAVPEHLRAVVARLDTEFAGAAQIEVQE